MKTQPPLQNPAAAAVALAAPDMRHSGSLPLAATSDALPGLRSDVLEFLSHAELSGLSTLGFGGWPVSHCMHFASVEGPGGRPILYMFTHDGRRKLLNIQRDARVAVLVSGAGRDRSAAAAGLTIQGVATLVASPEEHMFAMQAQFDKPGYDFARTIGLETQPALRIDAVTAVWQAPGEAREPVTLDYRDTFHSEHEEA